MSKKRQIKEVQVKNDRSAFNCKPCEGEGLLVNGNICSECRGTGKVAAVVNEKRETRVGTRLSILGV